VQLVPNFQYIYDFISTHISKARMISELDSRMFYKGQKQSSGRSSVLPHDAAKITPMVSYVTKSSRQKSIFHVQHLRAGEISECKGMGKC
jgi:hypothetical protein